MKIVFLAAVIALAFSQDPASKPQRDSHDTMNTRGEHAMGFSQTSTTHHFFLKPNGGVIQVEANDAKETTSRDNIRMHLDHIVRAFQNGDFDSDVRPRYWFTGRSRDEAATKTDSLLVRRNSDWRTCGHNINGQARAQFDS